MKGWYKTIKNIRYELVGSELTIKVDVSKDFGPSHSGKTIIIATSEGNEPLGNGVIMGLNVYRKVGKGNE